MVEAATNKHHLLSLLLLLLAIAIATTVQCAEEKQEATLHHLQWGQQIQYPHISSPTKSTRWGAALELQRRSHSPAAAESKDDYIQHLNIFISDKGRVSSLQSELKRSGKTKQRSSEAAQIPLTSGIKLQTLNYVVNVAIGGKKRTVIVDTGSDLTWVQCKPCTYCYNQQDPLFDPTSSPSYHAIPCGSPACDSLLSATGAPGNCGLDNSSCYYGLSYGDGSYTRGVLAKEQILLGRTAVSDFTFGCGRNNRGLFGGAAGLMGLGRSPLSLISQTTAQFGGVFSYCLPSKNLNSSGSLVLGDDISLYHNSTPFSFTRMITDPLQSPFYFLNLTGVSVGGVAVAASSLSKKILIDSGTVITRLPPSIYAAVRAEFVKQFSGYPTAPSFSILDACYDLSSYEEVRVPTVKLGFEGGGELSVDVTGVFYFVKRDASQVCMAVTSLSSEDDVGIIGNYQQKNLRVVYDTVGSRVGFAQEACGSI